MSIHMAFWKESMINRLSKLINRNRSAAKMSQVLCSSIYAPPCHVFMYISANARTSVLKKLDFSQGRQI